MGSKRVRGRAVWLVTRHWMGDASRQEVAAIFNARLGGVRIREFVELIWVTSGYFTLDEQTSMMWPQHGRTPYAARFGQTKEGDPWEGEILCGDDPYLRARRVDDLTVERDDKGVERPVWKERPRGSSAGCTRSSRPHEPANAARLVRQDCAAIKKRGPPNQTPPELTHSPHSW